MNALEHSTPFVTILMSALAVIILITIITAKRGRDLFIRRIPGLTAIEEAVGRATEMGRPILFSVGLGGLDIVTLQALSILSHVARLAARYGTRVIVPVVDPIVYAVVEEVLRDAYIAEGKAEAFRAEDIRYLSDQQFAYAAGVVGMMNRERVATNLMFGTFFAESLILAENGFLVGALQVAGTPSTTQIPFFLATCDYVVIGDEYYAATAYLSREPTLLGSLFGQDIGKMVLLALIVVGTALVTLLGPANFLVRWLGGQ